MKTRTSLRRIGKKKQSRLDAEGTRAFSTITPKPLPRSAPKQKARKPIAKIGKQKAKRQARNREYYASAEWRAKRKAVFARDGYQCTETLLWLGAGFSEGDANLQVRCPNRGEIVNGKQTARDLVCEEVSYSGRGVEGSIHRLITRCRDCDRRLTPLERANHAQGFRKT